MTVVLDRARAEVRARGHAGYAEKGRDIVCAAVSALLGAFARSAPGADVRDDGETLRLRARRCADTAAQLALVEAGLRALAETYPEFVSVTVLGRNGRPNALQ